jgi:hypothetical protein
MVGLSIRPRLVMIGALVLVATVATTGYVATRANAARQLAAPAPVIDTSSLDAILEAPHVLFVDTTDAFHARVAAAPLAAPATGRVVTEMTCDRVYFSGSQGMCLGADEHYYGNRGAQAFDAGLRPGLKFNEVLGSSSRARVSASGRYAAVTVFVTGDSYGAPFSTRTHVLDLVAGRNLGTLEDFTAFKDGKVFQSPDFNFWGVTFARDDNVFYATLASGNVGATSYLVKGDVAKRTVTVLRTNVECPSLAPDGKRVAFKKRIEGGTWRIAVLDLATLQDHLIGEARSVDDQVEWLDDEHVLYGLPQPGSGTMRIAQDVWLASVVANSPPQLFLENAMSPVVVR